MVYIKQYSQSRKFYYIYFISFIYLQILYIYIYMEYINTHTYTRRDYELIYIYILNDQSEQSQQINTRITFNSILFETRLFE